MVPLSSTEAAAAVGTHSATVSVSIITASKPASNCFVRFIVIPPIHSALRRNFCFYYKHRNRGAVAGVLPG